ncbi:MAG: 4Fe-4S dicluster domain-containing protein, partial [Spirochaetes bacterium]|nr:4Fe-4S dicluster domain-containing protein [Spirochaetota bacterium]
MYSGSLFNYLRSMGIKLPGKSGDTVPDALTIAVSAHRNTILPSIDEYILYFETEKIITALKTVMENCRSEQGLFLVSGSSRELAENLRQRLRPEDKLKLMVVKDLYTAAGFDNSGEKYLPRIPGCFGKDAAQGVGTVYSAREMIRIYEAVTEQKPVTDVFVYCAGEVNRPSVVNVPVGTSYSDVVRACGGPVTEDYVIAGESSFNSVEKDTETPVDKDTDTIIVLGSENPLVKRFEVSFPAELKRIKSACSHCRFCTDMCPVYLEGRNLFPHLIVQALADGNAAESPWVAGAELCTECGICTAVCPSGLSPVK